MKAGATTAVVGAVTSVAAASSLPVVGIAVAGVAASVVADWAIKKIGVDKKLKSGVNALIKGASKWFK